MKLKTKHEIEVAEETMNKIVASLSYMKATGEPLYDEWVCYPKEEVKLQIDYILRLIQNLKEV